MSSNDAVLKEKEQQARHLEDKGQQLQKEVRSRSKRTLTRMCRTIFFIIIIILIHILKTFHVCLCIMCVFRFPAYKKRRHCSNRIQKTK